jgi:putative endonuclease
LAAPSPGFQNQRQERSWFACHEVVRRTKTEVQLGEPKRKPSLRTGLSFCIYPDIEPSAINSHSSSESIGEYDMTFYVYILQSQTTGRYYCGHTADLERRLRQHNDPEDRPNATTRRFSGPWQLSWTEEHPSRNSSMIRERQIKKRGLKRFLEELPNCPSQA